MNDTINAIEPPHAPNSGQPQGGDAYVFVVGFFCVIVILISLTYTSYICKRSRLSEPTSITFTTAAYEDTDSRRLIRFSRGIDDDVLVTFPTFLYSDAKAPSKGDTIATDSSCSICLADYKPLDVVRLLPVCGHLYHVTCIDTWLKAHPTCPMCRNMPLSGPDVVTSSETD